VSNVGFCFGWLTDQRGQVPKEKNVKVVKPPPPPPPPPPLFSPPHHKKKKK